MKNLPKPKIILVSDDRITNQQIRRAGVDIVEIRVDTFKSVQLPYVLKVVQERKALGLPLLLTVRNQVKEGASRVLLSNPQKLEIVRACLPLVDMIDIEFSYHDLAKIMALVKAAKKKIILSAHFFESVPKNLLSLYRQMRRMQPDWVKIAVMPKSVADVWVLTELTLKSKGKMISMAMGEMGRLSRLFLPMAGSPFVYTFIGKAKAPGQIDLKTLKSHLKFYYS